MSPRFGLFFLPTLSHARQAGVKLAGMLELIREAERLGFSHAWFAEHHLSSYGGLIPSPSILCAAAGVATRRLRLGSCAVILPFHDPVVVAEEFALLDVMTEGRVDLGLGRGFLPFEKARLARSGSEDAGALERDIETIVECWSAGGRTGYPTRTRPELPYSLCQEPHPPIWLAVSTRLNNARFAGARGFGLMLNPYTRTEAELLAIRAAYSEAWTQSGRSWSDRRVLAHFFLYLNPQPEAVRNEAKPQLDQYLGHLEAALVLGESAGRKFPTTFDQLYPERVLMGAPADIADSLKRWTEWGVTDFAFSVSFGDLSTSSASRTMALFAAAFIRESRHGGV
ncbi:MAG TPA: LLM class flavin-dependent oxidoreductase [Opitutaceae bacterium]